MYRQIELNPNRLTTQNEMQKYMQELFFFESEDAAADLGALEDSLSEVKDEIDFILTPDAIMKICMDEFAYKVLLAVGRACDRNPNLNVLFRRG